MNEKRRARIIGECIEMVQTGRKTRSDCVGRYPQLTDELQSAFSSFKVISSISFSEVDPMYQRKRKINLTKKLPDRENIVTKRIDYRYRLQNLKRRIVMTWVVIVTTILSLISGTGVVYASNDALPGDTLYPVKTWVENIQLAIAPEDVDTGLHMRFAEHRVDEAVELILEGRFEDLDEAVDGYQKRAELLTQTMARLQAEDSEEAVKLRLELEKKLQEQARLMEAFLEDGEETGHHQQMQEMLETNTELRLRINENENESKPEITDLGEEEETSSGESGSAEIGTEDTQGQNRSGSPSFEVNNEDGTMVFGLGGKEGNGVFAEVDGGRFDCTIEGGIATCNMNGSPQKGNVNLYDKETNLLLFSYAYEYANEHLWEGDKSDNGNSGENLEGGNSGKGTDKNSKDN